MLAQAYYDLNDAVPPLAFVRDLRAVTLVEQVCAKIDRDLTREEWSSYLPDRPYEAVCPD